MKNRLLLCWLLLMTFLMPSFAQTQLTPEQVAQKTRNIISNASGIYAKFSLEGNGRSGEGWIKSAGKKFNVGFPGVEIWYNGKDLYTYSARSAETTVVEPTASELLESNPLLYIRDGAGAYNYSFSPVKRTGKYVVDLVPRNAKSDVKKLTVTVNSSSFKPERIVVVTKQGTLSIDIKELNITATHADNVFEYPKAKYPKAEIVDLR